MSRLAGASFLPPAGGRGRGFALALALALALAPEVAAAAPPKISIQLRADPEHLPTHVCVVARGKGEGAIAVDEFRRRGSDHGEYWRADAGPPAGAGARSPIDAALEALTPGPNDENAADPCPWGDDATRCEPSIRFARRPASGSSSTSESKSNGYIKCAANSVDTGRGGRVLVLDISNSATPFGDTILVHDLRLNGSLLQLGLSHRLDAGDGDKLRILGGFYVQGLELPLEPSSEAIELPIAPRCRWTPVHMPPSVARQEPDREMTVTLKPGGEAPEVKGASGQCYRKGATRQRIDALIPPGDGVKERVLKIVTRSGDRENHLEAHWSEPQPATLSARATRLNFEWSVNECFYLPSKTCPTARIADSGIKCDNLGAKVEDGACRYVCTNELGLDLGKGLDIVFVEPAEVRPTEVKQTTAVVPPAAARAATDEASAGKWTLRLVAIDQILYGYLAERDRTASLDFTGWRHADGARDGSRRGAVTGRQRLDVVRIDALGDPIERIDLYGGQSAAPRATFDLEAHAAAPSTLVDPKPRIPAPNLACHEPVRYEIHGERDYRPGYARLENGALTIQPPSAHARVTYATVAVLPIALARVIAPASTSGRSKFVYSPELHIGVTHRPFARARGWRFEYTLGVVQSSIPLEPIPIPDTGPLYVPYTRWMPSFTALTPLPWARVRFASVGVGVGGAWGYATLRRDASFAGAYDFSLGAHLDLRARLGRRVAVVLRNRFLALEDNRTFTTDFKGTPSLDEGLNHRAWYMPSVGLVFTW